MIKTAWILIGFLGLSLGSAAQLFRITDQGSSIKFKIRNLGISITGSFTGLQGQVQFDPDHPENAHIEASVDANSINTGIDMRDDHLRGEDYFDVQKYPRIRFQSTKVARGRRGTYRLTGTLSIKDVSREITFPFSMTEQNGGVLYSGEFKMNRRDFNVGGSSFTLSDDLLVQVSVFVPGA